MQDINIKVEVNNEEAFDSLVETYKGQEVSKAEAQEVPNICDPADDNLCDSCA